MGRSPCCSKEEGLNRGAWTTLEDQILKDYIKAQGEGKWRSIPKKAGLKRCGKSCRLRWLNYLRPDIKRGNITRDEEDLIIRLHKLLGNRWSLIAGRLPGRTDNEIKNYWNSTLAKREQGNNSNQSKNENNNKKKRIATDSINGNTTKDDDEATKPQPLTAEPEPQASDDDNRVISGAGQSVNGVYSASSEEDQWLSAVDTNVGVSHRHDIDLSMILEKDCDIFNEFISDFDVNSYMTSLLEVNDGDSTGGALSVGGWGATDCIQGDMSNLDFGSLTTSMLRPADQDRIG